MKHLEMLRDTPSMLIEQEPSPAKPLRRNTTISHSQENLHNSTILQNIEKLKFKYDGYISDN